MQVRALSFTGSTCTDRTIQTAPAKSSLEETVFELGGKSPVIIFEDADIEQAAHETETSINWNSRHSRVYVQESITMQFIEAFPKLMRSRRMGYPTDLGVNHGPQADKIQHENVVKYIQLGEEAALSNIDTGSESNSTTPIPEANSKSLLVHPVIFTNVPETSRIAKKSSIP